ncbi:hypothetical protein [Maribacter sp. IgM3_T14_3]|uniref:hypothetical protein n=1 Tax=Maribacter sp. IgM3_T14_3 TaxID=3415140 RepID=UPI003C6FED81
MKTNIIFCICLVFFSLTTTAQFETRIIQEEINAIWNENNSDRITKLNELLKNAPSKLDGIDTAESDYWIAYLHYKTGISYLSDDKEKTKEHFTKGINILEKIEKPNTETLSLEGTLNSTMISIQSDKAWALSQKAGELFEKAIKLSEKNPRAYLGLGKSDFYKPAQYGGGKKVEAYLKKAISYYEEQEKSEKKGPSWGKDEAFYFLSAFYSKNNRDRDAKFYNSLGLKEFPKNMVLLAQKEKLN